MEAQCVQATVIAINKNVTSQLSTDHATRDEIKVSLDCLFVAFAAVCENDLLICLRDRLSVKLYCKVECSFL